MNPTIKALIQNKPALIDGSWGTQLQARGLPIGASAESWNLDSPQNVSAIAQAYVNAGSNIILTNTLCGNRIMLKRHGLADKTIEINTTGAALSKAAAGTTAKVFGSMGPTGKSLMKGQTTKKELTSIFTEQANAIAAGGADGLVIETMTDLKETTIAIRAAKHTGLPIAACMVYTSGLHNDHTIMGDTPEQAAETLAEAGADILGANCGIGIETYIPITARLKAACDLPIWIKPNAGTPQIINGIAKYKMTPETFAQRMLQIIHNGATFIGGCCGTNPAFISALHKIIKKNT